MKEIKLLKILDILSIIEKKINLVFIDAGITLSQFRILRLIEIEPGLSMSELSRKLSITKPTVNMHLSILHKMDAIRIIVDISDKRGKKIFLTKTGENRISNAYENLYLLERNNQKQFTPKLLECLENFFLTLDK